MGQLGCLVGIELWVVILLLAESSPIRCLLCAYVFSSISNRSLLLLRFQILDFMESTMNMKERIKSRIDTKNNYFSPLSINLALDRRFKS